MQYTLNKHGPRDGPASSTSVTDLFEGLGIKVSGFHSNQDFFSYSVSPSPPLSLTPSQKPPGELGLTTLKHSPGNFASGYSATSRIEYPRSKRHTRLDSPTRYITRDGGLQEDFCKTGEVWISHSALRIPHSERIKFEGLRFFEINCKDYRFTPSLPLSLTPSMSAFRIPYSAKTTSFGDFEVMGIAHSLPLSLSPSISRDMELINAERQTLNAEHIKLNTGHKNINDKP